MDRDIRVVGFGAMGLAFPRVLGFGFKGFRECRVKGLGIVLRCWAATQYACVFFRISSLGAGCGLLPVLT